MNVNIAKLARTGAVALGAVALGACTVYSRPARTEVRSAEYPPPPPPAPTDVVYDQPPPPPPAPLIEIPPLPPPDFAWIGGYYQWSGNGYTWTPGHYERRPHPNAHYRPAHWEQRGRGHVWVQAGWD